MLSAVLSSKTAINVSIKIISAFIEMRKFLRDNADVFVRLEQVERKQLKADEPVTIKQFKNAHDRFLIIDGAEVYHIGASLKDLGTKWFAFSKMEMNASEILKRLT